MILGSLHWHLIVTISSWGQWSPVTLVTAMAKSDEIIATIRADLGLVSSLRADQRGLRRSNIKMDENCDGPICLPRGQDQTPSSLNTQLFRIKPPDLGTLTHHPPARASRCRSPGTEHEYNLNFIQLLWSVWKFRFFCWKKWHNLRIWSNWCPVWNVSKHYGRNTYTYIIQTLESDFELS